LVEHFHGKEGVSGSSPLLGFGLETGISATDALGLAAARALRGHKLYADPHSGAGHSAFHLASRITFFLSTALDGEVLEHARVVAPSRSGRRRGPGLGLRGLDREGARGG
jgi:hypothetical protein